MKSIVSKSIPIIIGAAVFLVAYLAMGRAGYRAGARVSAGAFDVDPELLKAIVASLLALVTGWLSQQPWGKWILSLFPAGGGAMPTFGGLTAEQDQRLKAIANRVDGVSDSLTERDKRLAVIEAAILRVESQTKPVPSP